MSILSTQSQGSTSSSSVQTPSLNPNSNHGHLFHSQQPSSSAISAGILSFGSLGFSDSLSPGTTSGADSGTAVAPAAEDSSGSFKRVTDLETTNDKRILPQQNSYTHSQFHSGGGQVGFANRREKMSGKIVSSGSQQTTGLSSSHGSNTNSAGKKVQMINGNHLLNFQYDPISRTQPRAPPPPRRQQRRKPYNKDLFIQANYKFVVLDSGHYTPESMDPDKNLQWEDIICVRYATPFPVQCPICLEYPLCAQITSCGHIFCFPCILQYLLMGEEDNKGDCWKRCPLCFVMISPKDLYTVDIENVNQYHVGDTIDFMLLTRQKDSFTLSQKNNRETGNVGCGNDEVYNPFSKFTLTSDVDLSVRQSISDLDSWLVKADSGLVDDLEKLPYVCAAMEQLEQRKKYWNEHRAYDSNRSSKCDREIVSHVCPSTANATNVDKEVHGFGHGTQSTDISKSPEGLNAVLSSYDESNCLYGHSNGFRDTKDNDSYNFYQAVDGQHLILHPLDMKCMLHHYGSYDMLPHRIRGKILQFESVTQSEAMRRRYRYLSHFSLTTTFQLCEIDLNEILPPESLSPFMDEIKKREKQRKLLAKKERKDKLKADAAGTDYVPIFSSYGQSSYGDPPSMDEFEALGTPIVTSSSPPAIGERKLFSSVAKLGFAAGHDSPALKIEESSSVHDNFSSTDSSSVNASRNTSTQSFATIISRAKSVENLDAPKANESGKKGKKPSRVLLSTAGGRRY